MHKESVNQIDAFFQKRAKEEKRFADEYAICGADFHSAFPSFAEDSLLYLEPLRPVLHEVILTPTVYISIQPRESI